MARRAQRLKVPRHRLPPRTQRHHVVHLRRRIPAQPATMLIPPEDAIPDAPHPPPATRLSPPKRKPARAPLAARTIRRPATAVQAQPHRHRPAPRGRPRPRHPDRNARSTSPGSSRHGPRGERRCPGKRPDFNITTSRRYGTPNSSDACRSDKNPSPLTSGPSPRRANRFRAAPSPLNKNGRTLDACEDDNHPISAASSPADQRPPRSPTGPRGERTRRPARQPRLEHNCSTACGERPSRAAISLIGTTPRRARTYCTSSADHGRGACPCSNGAEGTTRNVPQDRHASSSASRKTREPHRGQLAPGLTPPTPRAGRAPHRAMCP
jgi:hypothetical protein